MRTRRRRSPISVQYDENYGGFLGFKVEERYYSSLETLPKEYHQYVVSDQTPKDSCKNGHPRWEFGTVNSQGYFRCRRCDRDGARERRKKRGNHAL